MSRGVSMSRAPSRYLGPRARTGLGSPPGLVGELRRAPVDLPPHVGRQLGHGARGRQRAGDDLRLGRGPAALPAAVGPLLLGALDRRAAVLRAPDLLDVAVAGPGRRAGLLGRDRRGGLQERARRSAAPPRRSAAPRTARWPRRWPARLRSPRGSGGGAGARRRGPAAGRSRRRSAPSAPSGAEQVLDHVSSKVSRRASRPRLSSERTVAGRQPSARAIASSGRSCT